MAFISIDKRKEPQFVPSGETAGMVVPPQKHTKADPVINAINENIGTVSRQLRMLEERYITLRKKIQVSDQSIIEDTNKIFTQLKLIVQDISEIKSQIEDMRQKLEMFSNEIGDMASRQDLKILQRYVDMWEPMQFLTENEATEIIRRVLLEQKKDKPKKK